jgi:hypothetical protein
MYTVKRIGIFSAVKMGAILSAMLVVVPIVILLVLNNIFKFWDVIIPPELLIESLASAAFWSAVWGGLFTGVIVIIYNISARFFGGIKVELHMQPPPRKQHEQVDID